MNLTRLWNIITVEARPYYHEEAYSEVLKEHHDQPIGDHIIRELLEPLRQRLLIEFTDKEKSLFNEHFEKFIPRAITDYRNDERMYNRITIKSSLFSKEWAEELSKFYARHLYDFLVNKLLKDSQSKE